MLFFWFSGNESIDRVLTNYWFDPVLHQFPWKDNVLLDAINHRLAKYLVIAAGTIVLFAGVIRRHHRLVTVALLMGAGALVVGLLKAVSHHSCPWDLVDYGGQAISWPLFGQVPTNSGPGHCFPGGHASSGFMVMAFFFLFYPEKPRLAWISLVIGIVLGLAMGYGQVMRAHIFLAITYGLAGGSGLPRLPAISLSPIFFRVNKDNFDGSIKHHAVFDGECHTGLSCMVIASGHIFRP